MIFRQATPGDVDGVCLLYRMAAQSPFSVWNQEYPSRLEAEHDQETGNLFVLAEGDTIVGTISIVPESEMVDMDIWQYPQSGHREIARIALAPAFQGKGLAAELVRSIFPVLLECGYTSVRLSAACSNLPACRTYEKLGFSIRAEADMYDSHYYLMEKALIPSGAKK